MLIDEDVLDHLTTVFISEPGAQKVILEMVYCDRVKIICQNSVKGLSVLALDK